MIKRIKPGVYEFYDIAPKTTDGRTIDGYEPLMRAKELATTLLLSRGAEPEEAELIFGVSISQVYRRLQSVCEGEGVDPEFLQSGRPIEDIRDECINVMYKCDYTVIDLSEIWDLSQNRISEIVRR